MGDLEGADRPIQEDRSPDQPDEGDGFEPLRERVVLDALEGDGRRRDHGRGHREAEDHPFRDQMVFRSRDPFCTE